MRARDAFRDLSACVSGLKIGRVVRAARHGIAATVQHDAAPCVVLPLLFLGFGVGFFERGDNFLKIVHDDLYLDGDL